MALATLEDVKRKLRIREADTDDERDGWLQDELDAAAAWVTSVVGPGWTDDLRIQTITLTNDTGVSSFKLTYNSVEGATAFVRGTNQTAAAIQAALRTATTDTGLLVVGDTDGGPFKVVFSSGFSPSLLSVTSPSGSLTGSVARTKTYYDIREDASLLLPQSGCTVSAVRVSFWVDILFSTTDTNVLLIGQDYTIDDARRVLTLRPALTQWVFENAYGARMARVFRQVEVDWVPSTAAVPLALRDACAIMAAGQYASGLRIAAGLTGEKMGDYSYSARISSGGFVQGAPMNGPADYVEEAMRLLRPYINRRAEVI